MQLNERGEDLGGERIEGVLDVGQKQQVLVRGTFSLEAVKHLAVQAPSADHEEVDHLGPQVLLQVQPEVRSSVKFGKLVRVTFKGAENKVKHDD